MAKLRVHNLAMSADGYVAGPGQGTDNPLGVRGEELHEWIFATRTWLRMTGEGGGEAGVDDDFMAAANVNIGATIMGRNMFGPVRGEWGGSDWTGWWGDEPPYHHPVFVLTHHPRPSIEMQGGTTFHFVTDGIEVALEQAYDAAGGADVRLGGGAATVQQYLRAGLLDDLHVAIVPILLGDGARLFDNLDGGPAGYTCTQFAASPSVAHVRFSRTG
ncbi:MAG: dihydrofolate reductase family protein [Acidimicrobiales bacterium]